MSITIGRLKKGIDVNISETSPNQHISIFGISGCGKSTRIKEIILSSFKLGNTIIVFDIGGMDFYPSDTFKNIDDQYINRISAIHDGIDLHFLEDISSDSQAEYINFVSYMTDVISGTIRLGDQQRGALMNAISYAMHESKCSSEMDAIVQGLKEQDTPSSKSVLNKLWPILKCNILHDKGKKIEKGKINILSFQKINPSTQKQLIEIILAAIWRMLRSNDINMEGTSVILDEFQNLSFRQNSTLLEMLRESRKYNVNLVLSTQTISSFKKEILGAINQTAIQLYFKPTSSDINRIASIIDPNNAEEWISTLRLLKIGQSVTLGNISIKGKEIRNPLIIQSHYESE